MTTKKLKLWLIDNIMLIVLIILGVYSIKEYYSKINLTFFIISIVYFMVLMFFEKKKIFRKKTSDIFFISHQGAYLFVFSTFVTKSHLGIEKALFAFVMGLIVFNIAIYLLGIFCYKKFKK